MEASRSSIEELSRSLHGRVRLNFTWLIVLGFYDGPENGIALFTSGEAIAFSSLGDSTSASFRAFSLWALEGNWLAKAKALPEVATQDASRDFILAYDSEPLAELEAALKAADICKSYIGVGDTYLKWLKLAEVSEQEAAQSMGQANTSAKGFRAAHRIIKLAQRR